MDRVDAVDQWGRAAAQPISEVDYRHSMATTEWVKKYAPDEPEANPGKPIDWMKVPI